MVTLQQSEYDKNPLYMRPGETIDQYNARAVGDTTGKQLSTLTGNTTLAEDMAKTANQGKPGYDVLGNPIDTKAAEMKKAESASASQITADNGTARADEAKLGESIKSATTRPAFDLSYITQQEDALRARRASEEASINAQFDAARTGLEQSQKSEIGSTSAGLARAGGYLGVSASGLGVMQNLAQTHKSDMAALESKRQAALAEARNAYEDKQFALAKTRIQEAKEYEQETYTRQKDYFDMLKKESDKLKEIEREKQVNDLIYDAVQSGKTNGTDIYGALDGLASPDEIDTFLSKLKPLTGEEDNFKPTNAQVGLLLGSGMGKKDMQALVDYINTKGYDSSIKETLTPYQRKVVDSIFTLKPEKPAGAGGIKVSYVPTMIQDVVNEHGATNTYGSLLSNAVPQWFSERARYALPPGKDEFESAQSTKDMTQLWNEFRSDPEIRTFIQQMNRKILGTIDPDDSNSMFLKLLQQRDAQKSAQPATPTDVPTADDMDSDL